jgi:F0F1-type ATP synthase epsilon subunit
VAQESGQTIANKTAGTTPTDGEHMHVKVYAPFKTYFDGIAKSVTAVNDTGPFDVLAQHHNFITIVSTCDIVIQTDNGEEIVPIQKGVMHVKADEVVIFLDV